jgi:hypothetical protein
MPAASYQLALTGAPKRLSDVYGDGAGVVNAANDIPFRQLILQASAASTIGSSAATAGAMGLPIAIATVLTLGPFPTGPLKLSEFWAQGTGNLSILGIPY